MSELVKKACAQAGGSYVGNACRCSDGRLLNMATGECVSERDAGPAITPVQQPGRVWDSASGRYVDANTPTGSTPKVITTVSGMGDRRAVTDKRAEVTNMLTPTRTATGSLQRSLGQFFEDFANRIKPSEFEPTVTDVDGGQGVPTDAPGVELTLTYGPTGWWAHTDGRTEQGRSDRPPTRSAGWTWSPTKPNAKPPKIRDGSAGNQKMGAADSVSGANGNGAPMESGIPAGLILAGLSFLLFRS